jgi:hypothetical protein
MRQLPAATVDIRGFCVFEPINPLVALLESDSRRTDYEVS